MSIVNDTRIWRIPTEFGDIDVYVSFEGSRIFLRYACDFSRDEFEEWNIKYGSAITDYIRSKYIELFQEFCDDVAYKILVSGTGKCIPVLNDDGTQIKVPRGSAKSGLLRGAFGSDEAD